MPLLGEVVLSLKDTLDKCAAIMTEDLDVVRSREQELAEIIEEMHRIEQDSPKENGANLSVTVSNFANTVLDLFTPEGQGGQHQCEILPQPETEPNDVMPPDTEIPEPEPTAEGPSANTETKMDGLNVELPPLQPQAEVECEALEESKMDLEESKVDSGETENDEAGPESTPAQPENNVPVAKSAKPAKEKEGKVPEKMKPSPRARAKGSTAKPKATAKKTAKGKAKAAASKKSHTPEMTVNTKSKASKRKHEETMTAKEVQAKMHCVTCLKLLNLSPAVPSLAFGLGLFRCLACSKDSWRFSRSTPGKGNSCEKGVARLILML